jgi:hypothetical protein
MIITVSDDALLMLCACVFASVCSGNCSSGGSGAAAQKQWVKQQRQKQRKRYANADDDYCSDDSDTTSSNTTSNSSASSSSGNDGSRLFLKVDTHTPRLKSGSYCKGDLWAVSVGGLYQVAWHIQLLHYMSLKLVVGITSRTAAGTAAPAATDAATAADCCMLQLQCLR